MPDSIRRFVLTAILALSAGFGSPTAYSAEIAPARRITYAAPADATHASIAAYLAEQTGWKIERRNYPDDPTYRPNWQNVTIWQALHDWADAGDGQLEFANGGATIILRKRTGIPPSPSTIVGPFRIAARTARARLDFDSGTNQQELELELRWEPGLRVYRIDAYPTIIAAKADQGTTLTAPATKVRTAVSGNSTNMMIRWNTIPREARRIDELRAEVQATIAERMLVYRFPMLSDSPAQTIAGVKAQHTLSRRGEGWLLEVMLDYGAALPEFESFENWMGENQAELIAPDGKSMSLSDPEIRILNNGRYSIRYRFTEPMLGNDVKKWSLVYSTPSTLREVMIPFTLKQIPLP